MFVGGMERGFIKDFKVKELVITALLHIHVIINIHIYKYNFKQINFINKNLIFF